MQMDFLLIYLMVMVSTTGFMDSNRILISLGSKISYFNTPDFTKVQRISSGFVCPNNGWINIYRGIYNYGMRLYINNILVSTAWLYWDCAYNRDEQNYNIVPVSKDDVITFSGGKNVKKAVQ